MHVTLTSIDSTYTKPGGLTALHLEDLTPPDGFTIRTRSLVILAPGAVGGNHQHPRQECFIGIGEGLAIAWLDTRGQIHEAPMNPDGQLQLCHVPSNLPHAIINRGTSTAVVYELADATQPLADVQAVPVISSSSVG